MKRIAQALVAVYVAGFALSFGYLLFANGLDLFLDVGALAFCLLLSILWPLTLSAIFHLTH